MTSTGAPHVRAVALVAVGGAVGAVLRHALSTAFPDGDGAFPWTVFGINVVGSGLLALLPALAVVRRRASLSPLLGPGVLGGFTTLSTYSEQSRALVAQGHGLLAAGYVTGTLLAALLAVHAADRLSSPGQRTTSADEGGDE